MCWFLWFTFNDKDLLKDLWQYLYNRNKDWEIFYCSDNLSYYHASLKLSDLDKNQDQPLIYKSYMIWFIWEIYNKEYLLNLIWLKWEEKYTELQVIWLLFEKKWPKFIDYVNWEFVIFIYDEKTKKYYLFRDRYWVHSVYYKIKNQKLYFSSEIKNLILKKTDLKLNKKAFFEYLIFKFSISPNTLVDWVNILNPWHYLEYSLDNLVIKKFWEYISQGNKETFIETLEKSVIRRIPKFKNRIFLPISWWADSNLVLYFLNKHFKWEIITYTFFNENNIEDVEIAKKNVKNYGLKHLLIDINKLDKSFEDNIFIHEWLVKLNNIWKVLRNKYPEYSDINIEFTWDWREELLLVNNHYNYVNIITTYLYLLKRGFISRYNITQEFLNLNMFDFNLQLIEKVTLNNLIERRLPFTDYELLRFKWYKWYKMEAKKFLYDKWIDIVKWNYGHNNGINFKYLEKNKLNKYIKIYFNQLYKKT